MNTVKFYDIHGRLKKITLPSSHEEWIHGYRQKQATEYMFQNAPKIHSYLTNRKG